MRRRGFGVLALVLLFASLFAISTFGVGDDVVRLLHSNSGAYLQRKANFAAYAGLQRCLSELDKTTVYDGDGSRYYSTWNPGESISDVPMPGETEVFYTVRVVNNSRGDLGAPFVDEDGTAVPVGLVYIKVKTVARPAGNQRGRVYSANIASLGFVGQVHWQHALLGAKQVTLAHESKVDAYDSREAQPYPDGSTSKSSQPFATVASNGTRRSLQLLSGTKVKGNVRWGPSGVAGKALVQDADASISGDANSNQRLYRIPRFRPPYHPDLAQQRVELQPGETLSLAPGAYRSVKLAAGSRLRLQSGKYAATASVPRYYVDEFVRVEGGTIELEGSDPASRVEFYVGETFEVTAAGQVNPWVSPAQSRANRFQLIFVGNGSPHSPQKLVLNQQSKLWAVALGQGLVCNLDQGSHLFGAVRAFEVSLDNASEAHWDRAIRQDTQIRGQVAWTLQGIFDELKDLDNLDFGAMADSGMDYTASDPAGSGGGGNDGGPGSADGEGGDQSGDGGSASGKGGEGNDGDGNGGDGGLK